jgi:hypothetical protein
MVVRITLSLEVDRSIMPAVPSEWSTPPEASDGLPITKAPKRVGGGWRQLVFPWYAEEQGQASGR